MHFPFSQLGLFQVKALVTSWIKWEGELCPWQPLVLRAQAACKWQVSWHYSTPWWWLEMSGTSTRNQEISTKAKQVSDWTELSPSADTNGWISLGTKFQSPGHQFWRWKTSPQSHWSRTWCITTRVRTSIRRSISSVTISMEWSAVSQFSTEYWVLTK
jgi:hypothetical protein